MENETPESQIILYQTEDGRTRVQCRFENETIWLTQALIAELFQVSVPTINDHLKGIYDDGELDPTSTIRKFRIVRIEGKREVSRELDLYQRLKNPPGPGVPDYFDELLERIRDIRASERRMYLRVKEIFSLASD